MNPVRDFFDSLASSWDQKQTKKEEDIRPLFDRIGLRKGDFVLDLACGTGTVTRLIHSYTEEKVTGMDISPEMIAIAQKKYASCPWACFECADFLECEQVELYDFVVLYNAFPHFADPSLLSKKFAQVLKPGGRFAILHSLGRKELDAHHEAVPQNLSRHLNSPEEEAPAFGKEFSIEKAEEGEHFFLLTGKKR